MATFDAFGRRLDLDPVPKKPTVEKSKRVDAMLRKFASPSALAATSAAASQVGFETLEEFNDYDVPDDPAEPAGWEHPGDETYNDPPAEPDDGAAVAVPGPPPDGPGDSEPGKAPARATLVQLPNGRQMNIDDYLAAREAL